ncbi:hypothetical protein G7046_g2258 [Stylonectria norvegica]|nr:hypothetical protein G7046_g2258 [Stylonectria norvegica]
MLEPVCFSPSPAAHRLSAAGRKPNLDLQPWTAARCHRLLRQVQCRLTGLRRLVHEARNGVPARRSKRPGTSQEPPRPSKRSRYTYAQRRQPSQSGTTTTLTKATLTTPPRTVRTLRAMKFGRCSPAAGRVDFSTPMLRKLRDQPITPDSLKAKLETTPKIPLALAADLQLIRRLAPDGHYRIYEAIFTWLNGLLRSTEINGEAPHPKSLLGMCLRRVPASIAEIEAWERQVSEEEGTRSALQSSNASQELYGQLEAFGATGMGWKPLKLVVRAHGISILAAAISEGLFEPAFVSLLGQLCLHLKCNEEAATLVSSLNCPLATPRSSTSMFTENSKLQPLQAMVESFNGKRTPGASFDYFRFLVREQRLPLSWLSARAFRTVWTSTLEAVAGRQPAPSAMEFIYTALEHLALDDGTEGWSKQGSSSREQTLVSVAAGLAATAATLGAEMGVGRGLQRKRVFRRLIHVLNCSISHLLQRDRLAREGGLFILTMARYLALAQSSDTDTAARRQAEQECNELAAVDDEAAQTQYRQALLLACSMAQCRGRACGAPCHDMLSEICNMADDLAFPDWFRRGLRTDGAFVLAHKTKDLRDLAFAERLPATATGSCSTIFSGWRWEEGISEWVLPSPAPKARSGRKGGVAIGADAGDGAGDGEGAQLKGRGTRRRRDIGGIGLRNEGKNSNNDSSNNDNSCSDDSDNSDNDSFDVGNGFTRWCATGNNSGNTSSGDELNSSISGSSNTCLQTRQTHTHTTQTTQMTRIKITKKTKQTKSKTYTRSVRDLASTSTTPTSGGSRSAATSGASRSRQGTTGAIFRGLSRVCQGEGLDGDDWDELV